MVDENTVTIEDVEAADAAGEIVDTPHLDVITENAESAIEAGSGLFETIGDIIRGLFDLI